MSSWKTVLILIALGLPAGSVQAMPRFEDYPIAVEIIPPGHRVEPKLPAEEASRHEPKLTWALAEDLPERPNFAGHMAFIPLGCGSGCATGVAIDLRTGRGFFFPSTISIDLSDMDVDGDEERQRYRPDSRLFTARGIHNEDGKSRQTYYYFDDQKGFILIADEPIALLPAD